MKKFKVIFLIVAAVILLFTACSDDSKEVKEIESVTREEKKEVISEDIPSENKENLDETEPQEEETVAKENIAYDLGAIKEEIMTGIGAKDGLDFSANSIYAIYGIDASDMKQCAGFTVMEGTFPHEVVMIEASDGESAVRIEKAFQSKINAFAEQSKNYDAENYALAQKCKIEKNGRFYAMFLSPDYENIKAIYNKYIK